MFPKWGRLWSILWILLCPVFLNYFKEHSPWYACRDMTVRSVWQKQCNHSFGLLFGLCWIPFKASLESLHTLALNHNIMRTLPHVRRTWYITCLILFWLGMIFSLFKRYRIITKALLLGSRAVLCYPFDFLAQPQATAQWHACRTDWPQLGGT